MDSLPVALQPTRDRCMTLVSRWSCGLRYEAHTASSRCGLGENWDQPSSPTGTFKSITGLLRQYARRIAETIQVENQRGADVPSRC